MHNPTEGTLEAFHREAPRGRQRRSTCSERSRNRDRHDVAAAGAAVDNGAVDVRCQVVEGDDLEAVLPLLEGPNRLQTFRSEASSIA